MNKLSIKKTLALMIFTVIAVVFCYAYLMSNLYGRLDIEIMSGESGEVTLYYFNGNDSTPFDEDHSTHASFDATENGYTVNFTFPLSRMQMTRLDIDGASQVIIRNVAFSFLGKQHMVSLEKLSGTDCELSTEKEGIRFQRTGDDPKIPFDDLRFYNPNVLYVSLACGATALVLALLMVRLLKRHNLADKYYRYRFLFEELVKRDFKKKYKRTVLGMVWSMLNPLLMLLVMWMVFSRFFGTTMNHYVIYLFAGNIVFSFFSEATNTGMNSLISNAGIFTKVNIPKYMFLFSQSVTALINFGLTLIIFFLFVAVEGLPFTINYVCLLYPVICLVVFNLGVGMILSALFVFFRDIEYLWGVFTTLLMYMSAIFYTIDGYTQTVQYAFLLNPVYLYIRYFRKIVLEGIVPSPWFHILAAAYALLAIAIGAYVYKKNNTKFLYYV